MNLAHIALFIAALLWAPHTEPASPRCTATELPDPSCTSGAIDPSATLAVICGTSTETRRHVTTATKRAALAEYGVAWADRASVEVDHQIPLELGGANDISNLWAQPIAMARVKDVQENRSHALVCSGKASLEDEQKRFLTDWRTP